jgi:ATP-dependent 26S proteasome regulatory subunit
MGISAHGWGDCAPGSISSAANCSVAPGTGKTHTVPYLLSQLRYMTAFVLSGEALGSIGQSSELARLLQPSMVALEDIDLTASLWSFGSIGANPVLFEVLNHIDGLADEVDVTFLLTTNRLAILERALDERRGRPAGFVK